MLKLLLKTVQEREKTPDLSYQSPLLLKAKTTNLKG